MSINIEQQEIPQGTLQSIGGKPIGHTFVFIFDTAKSEVCIIDPAKHQATSKWLWSANKKRVSKIIPRELFPQDKELNYKYYSVSFDNDPEIGGNCAVYKYHLMKMIEHRFKGRTVDAKNINDTIEAEEADLNNQNLLSINNIGSVKKPLISYIIANKNTKEQVIKQDFTVTFESNFKNILEARMAYAQNSKN